MWLMVLNFNQSNPDAKLDRAGCHKKYDIFEVRPEGCSFGHIESGWGRDREVNGRDWPMLRLHCPFIPGTRFDLMEHYQVDHLLKGMCEGRFDKPLDEIMRSYCLDWDALPEINQMELRTRGETTLTELVATKCIKHKAGKFVDLVSM